MGDRYIGALILVRHGRTNYTNMPIDLTPEGIEDIRRAAREIKPIATMHARVRIYASEWQRTIDSAGILSAELDCPDVRPCAEIVGVYEKDPVRASEVRNGLRFGHTTVDALYATDPRFDDTDIFSESRPNVRLRFYRHLAAIIRDASGEELPICLISVSHFEVIYHLLDDAFGHDYGSEEPLRRGEHVTVLLSEDAGESVRFEIFFRNKTAVLRFDLQEARFVP